MQALESGHAGKPTLTIPELQEKARRLRIEVLKMTFGAGSGHPGGSFSMAEFLTALYYNRIQISPQGPKDPDRDLFILSKGHCAPGLYAVLGDLGFFPKTEFTRLRKFGGLLQGHADRKIPGIEMSTGSLGMGLGYGNGAALAKRMDGRKGRVYVVLGDGELQEGNIWESALTSSHRKLDSVCVIVDANKIQIDGWTKDIKNVDPIEAKFKAFGFWTKTVPGHDLKAILAAFDEAEQVKGQPQCLVMDTEKGHGVSFMVGSAQFHGRALTKDEMVKAMAELGETWTEGTA
ncbi:MAG TPA: transketolase [Candidatus Thermoplasmatota archaeon]|nr:transketolase [Candidatus Thermoplasmatota archaeon]